MAMPKLRHPGRSRFCHQRADSEPNAPEAFVASIRSLGSPCPLGMAMLVASSHMQPVYSGTRTVSRMSRRIASACSDFFWMET